MPLPGMADHGELLPYADSPWPCTLDELKERFVAQAPYAEERGRLFRALLLYVEVVWATYSDAVLWINGGFVTHKTWAAPVDVDVAVLVSRNDVLHSATKALGLWTLQGVSVLAPTVAAGRVQPFGGMIDGFFVAAELPAQRAMWHGNWSRVSLPDKTLDPTRRKGYVEVKP